MTNSDAAFNPEDFVVGEPLVMFYLGDTFGYGENVYEAVRECWRMADPRRQTPPLNLILARNGDRVLGAFRPERWTTCTRSNRRMGWGFIGEPAEENIQQQYVGKRVPERFRESRHEFRYLYPGD